MRRDNISALLYVLDVNDRERILKQAGRNKLKIDGFANPDKAPIAQISAKCNISQGQRKILLNSIVFYYLKKETEKISVEENLNITEQNAPGIIAYELLQKVPNEERVFTCFEKLKTKNKDGETKAEAQRLTSPDRIEKKAESFRKKYMDELKKTHTLEQKIEQQQKENVDSIHENQKLIKRVIELEKAIEIQQLKFDALKEEIKDSNNKLQELKEQDIKREQEKLKKKIILFGNESIDDKLCGHYAVSCYNAIDIKEVLQLISTFDEIWIIRQEVAFTIRRQITIIAKTLCREFDTRDELLQFIKKNGVEENGTK